MFILKLGKSPNARMMRFCVVVVPFARLYSLDLAMLQHLGMIHWSLYLLLNHKDNCSFILGAVVYVTLYVCDLLLYNKSISHMLLK